MGSFEGALTALVTPFRQDRVDEPALRALVAEQIAGGIDGLVPCGTTGESVNLSDAEYEQVLRIVIDEAKGRVPVIAGAGSASTRHTLELCTTAQRLGADGLLIVVPYYNKPTQEGLFAHYSAVTQAVSLPVMVYNIPTRCVVDLSVATLDRLSAFPSIVAIKESTGNVLRSAEIAARFGGRFTILSGDDALALPIMAVGGHGVVSVTSNVAPKAVSALVHTFRAGDAAGALQHAQRLRALVEAMFVETSPGPVKAALAMRGLIADEIRLPLVRPGEASLSRIREALQGMDLL